MNGVSRRAKSIPVTNGLFGHALGSAAPVAHERISGTGPPAAQLAPKMAKRLPPGPVKIERTLSDSHRMLQMMAEVGHLLPKGRSESAVPEPSWAGLPSTSSSAGGGARAQPGGVAGPGAHPVRPALPLAQRPRRHRLHHQEARRCSERDLGPPGDPRSGVRSGACSGAPDRARRPPRPHRPLTPSSPAPPAHR